MSKKYEQMSLREIITDVTCEELSERPDKEKTGEELMAMIANDRKRRRLKMLKVAGIAVICAVIIAVIGMSASVHSNIFDVGADKNNKQMIATEGDVVIEEKGYDSGESDELVITDWNQIENGYQGHLQDLIIPRYIPKEYKFVELKAENLEGIQTYVLQYKNKDFESLEIHQNYNYSELSSIELSENIKQYRSKNGIIYFKSYKNMIKATMQIDEGFIIDIWGTLSQEEFVKIFDNMNNNN